MSNFATPNNRAKLYPQLIRHITGLIAVLWQLIFNEEPPKNGHLT